MDKYTEELKFWKFWFNSFGSIEKYLANRKLGYQNLVDNLPHIKGAKGKGLDLGCGLVSIFEYSNLDVVAIDPLLAQYDEIYKLPEPRVKYEYGYKDDGILPFEDNEFGFVSCINVIDHTAFYQELIVEIQRVLIPTGHLYLQVNFDPVLHPPHHVKLWNRQVVEEELSGFKRLYEVVQWNDYHGKDYYWGLFRNTKI